MTKLQNHCVVFTAVPSNSLGVGLKHVFNNSFDGSSLSRM